MIDIYNTVSLGPIAIATVLFWNAVAVSIISDSIFFKKIHSSTTTNFHTKNLILLFNVTLN